MCCEIFKIKKKIESHFYGVLNNENNVLNAMKLFIALSLIDSTTILIMI